MVGGINWERGIVPRYPQRRGKLGKTAPIAGFPANRNAPIWICPALWHANLAFLGDTAAKPAFPVFLEGEGKPCVAYHVFPATT